MLPLSLATSPMLHLTPARICSLFVLCSGLLACQGQERPAADAGAKNRAPEQVAIAFTDVTAEIGLGSFQHENGAEGGMYLPEQMGAGGGFLDYDGDTWPDLLLVGGGWLETGPDDRIEALRLYRNNTDGTFTEVTEAAGLSGVRAYGQGIVAADYDNDGDDDFYFTTLRENDLFRNDGGRFTRVGAAAGVAGDPVWSSSALFFDADRDGDLDLYVANYVAWARETDIFCSIQGVIIVDTQGAGDLAKKYGEKIYCPPSEYAGIPGRFYRNRGDGTFAEATEQAGFVGSSGKSLGVAEFDFNRDGWPDVVVSNDAQPDLLYKNNGDGTFTEIGQRSGIALDDMGHARAGMGIDIGVVDGSGAESIFIGNFSSETIGVYAHAGDDLFRDRSADSRIGPPSFLTLTFGLTLFDVEHDGDLDLLAANGHVWPVRPSLDGSTYRQKPQLFLNRGDGVFAEAPARAGVLGAAMVARGLSYADYDRDGDLDVLVTENGGPAHVWRNDLAGAHYVNVRLRGTTSNRDGLGTHLIAVSGDKRLYRRIRTGSSYLSQSDKIASFGLGGNTRIDSLRIEWPSGKVDVLLNLESGQEIRVIEGSGDYEVIAAPR
ncbi:MAG: CRTAC1 family protein [Rhodothermales bacterium]